ncbi:tetratricopeptide repeat protein [Fuscibacter oryzae]|uniref:Tetratricopeptide repeat protein n=1 Tax=Fuscibacter oryzae TaxID=2803939 RepID=A0A8J7MTV2_9RHOB|nr:tetratricopeptide repeat protein [Fuscibacter oryzae]MBL4930088.1 tetratricopeptide repeat protein [Fuscibacter oryzae]
MTIRRIALGTTMALAISLLSACQSSEEKAEAHYQASLELLQKGDTDRALVELRNVFQLNGQHREARQTYARIQREKGNLREAYGQYLRLVEQYPDDFEGNVALAEMAMTNGAWDDAEKYAAAAAKAKPEDAGAKALVLISDYRKALLVKDDTITDKLVTEAETLLAANPKLSLLRKFLADEKSRKNDYAAALTLIDEGIKVDPGYDDFYTLRLALLYQMGETDKITEHLKAMIARKPDDAKTREMLIAWYMSQNNTEAAEQAIRAEIDPAKDDLPPRLRMIQFLLQTKGNDAARAEIEGYIAAMPSSPHAPLLQSMLAGLDFEAGKQAEAIAALQKIVEGNPTAPEISAIRISLAQMLSQTGNEVGARAIVEEVLQADASNAQALKLKASWLIDDDKTGDALIALRTALEQNPRDAEVMTLMARAHEREGNTELMADMLSQAVEASGQAPAESLRYAGLLQTQGKLQPSEDTLLNALRREPDNVDILGALGGLYLQMKDWGRADHIVRTLEAGKTDAAHRTADALKARLLAASGQETELTQFLEGLASQDSRPDAQMILVRDAVRRGDYDQALAQIADLETKYPDQPAVGLLHALVLSSSNKVPEAIARLQELTIKAPTFEQGWLALVNIQTASGDAAGAATSLDASLQAVPASKLLRWAKAGALERSGDVDGAIALYETLYTEDSNWLVVANNLASLLADHRDDAASLDRAYVIARRLRGADQPAFQDTYGWISFRRGSLDEALSALEPAAKGLPDDPAVQYHLAMTYGAMGRKDEALAILNKVASTVPAPPAALADKVQAEITRLETTPATQGNN